MSWQWSRRYRSARDTEPQIKEERILRVTTRCRFLPSCVRLAPTHPPLRSPAHTILVYTHVNIPTCTHKRQLHASSNRLPLFTLLLLLLLLFSSPGVSASSFLVLSSSWRWIILLRSCSRKQKPDGRRIHRASRLPHFLFLQVQFGDGCFDQFVRDRWRQDQLQTSRARALLTRKRRTKESSGPYGSCRCTFSASWKARLLCRTQKSGKDTDRREKTRKESAYDCFETCEIYIKIKLFPYFWKIAQSFSSFLTYNYIFWRNFMWKLVFIIIFLWRSRQGHYQFI